MIFLSLIPLSLAADATSSPFFQTRVYSRAREQSIDLRPSRVSLLQCLSFFGGQNDLLKCAYGRAFFYSVSLIRLSISISLSLRILAISSICLANNNSVASVITIILRNRIAKRATVALRCCCCCCLLVVSAKQ